MQQMHGRIAPGAWVTVCRGHAVGIAQVLGSNFAAVQKNVNIAQGFATFSTGFGGGIAVAAQESFAALPRRFADH
ncbi:hypothetical protein [Rhodobacter capsulatus]|uniref:hypothetical protein n=1 Tax=Rhodobacter capsulatus TaxID=1061 RepID=UPI001040D345|nr:hypothetical protein [Rhodobacter capsulatus]